MHAARGLLQAPSTHEEHPPTSVSAFPLEQEDFAPWEEPSRSTHNRDENTPPPSRRSSRLALAELDPESEPTTDHQRPDSPIPSASTPADQLEEGVPSWFSPVSRNKIKTPSDHLQTPPSKSSLLTSMPSFAEWMSPSKPPGAGGSGDPLDLADIAACVYHNAGAAQMPTSPVEEVLARHRAANKKE